MATCLVVNRPYESGLGDRRECSDVGPTDSVRLPCNGKVCSTTFTSLCSEVMLRSLHQAETERLPNPHPCIDRSLRDHLACRQSFDDG
jgi:hypothetical protein